MDKNQKIGAILLMAGVGDRFSSNLPKQFHTIHGKALYKYTLEKFLAVKEISQIILVCHKDYVTKVQKELPPSIKVINGGSTRQESSYLGLQALSPSTDIVLIHDAVRPFVSSKILQDNINTMSKYQAADTCIDTHDTIVQSLDKKTITAIPNRKTFLRGQTPQTFSYPLILKAHKYALENQISATDDCGLVQKLNTKIAIVQGSSQNIKITTYEDLLLARALAKQEKTLSISTPLLSKKTFILIGSSGGIGVEIQKLLENKGAKVIGLSRTSTPLSIDLRNSQSIKDCFTHILKKYRQVDGLINCAGLFTLKPFYSMTETEILASLQTNLLGLIQSCQLAPLKKGAHILNIASSSYLEGRKNYSIYSCSKAAVVNFTEALAKERPDLCINVLIPERTNTKMRKKVFPKEHLESLLSPSQVAQKAIKILQSKSSGGLFSVKKMGL